MIATARAAKETNVRAVWKYCQCSRIASQPGAIPGVRTGPWKYSASPFKRSARRDPAQQEAERAARIRHNVAWYPRAHAVEATKKDCVLPWRDSKHFPRRIRKLQVVANPVNVNRSGGEVRGERQYYVWLE